MSEGYMQIHDFLFEHQGPIFEHYVVAWKEGIKGDAEIQRQI